MEIEIHRVVNSPVDSIGYFIIQESHCIIIDPGSKKPEIYLRFLTDKSLTLDYIILTHEHFDHIWSTDHIKKAGGGKIICSEICANKISVPQNYFNLLYYDDETCLTIRNVDIIFNDVLDISWQGNPIHIFCTPGHTSGSICIQIGNSLFTGDTILYKVKPVIKKRDGGSKEQLWNSISKITARYNYPISVHPGHGSPFELHEVTEYYKRMLADSSVL